MITAERMKVNVRAEVFENFGRSVMNRVRNEEVRRRAGI